MGFTTTRVVGASASMDYSQSTHRTDQQFPTSIIGSVGCLIRIILFAIGPASIINLSRFNLKKQLRWLG